MVGQGRNVAGDAGCQFLFTVVHLETGTSNHSVVLKPQPVLLFALWLKLPVKYSCVTSLNTNIFFHLEGRSVTFPSSSDSL